MNNMKYVISLAALLFILTSCSKDIENSNVEGAAILNLQLTAEDCPVTLTKATSLPKVDDFKVRVKNEDASYDKTFDSYATLLKETPLFLKSGSYTVTAYSNEYKTQALGEPCFKADTTLTVVESETSTVKLICTLQQVMISFKCSEAFLSSFRHTEEFPFTLTISDSNNRTMAVPYDKLGESVYLAPGSEFIKLNLKATTMKGYPVDFTDYIRKNDESQLLAKDHIILNLNIKDADTKSVTLKSDIQ